MAFTFSCFSVSIYCNPICFGFSILYIKVVIGLTLSILEVIPNSHLARAGAEFSRGSNIPVVGIILS
jgi:hypothetical protein